MEHTKGKLERTQFSVNANNYHYLIVLDLRNEGLPATPLVGVISKPFVKDTEANADRLIKVWNGWDALVKLNQGRGETIANLSRESDLLRMELLRVEGRRDALVDAGKVLLKEPCDEDLCPHNNDSCPAFKMHQAITNAGGVI